MALTGDQASYRVLYLGDGIRIKDVGLAESNGVGDPSGRRNEVLVEVEAIKPGGWVKCRGEGYVDEPSPVRDQCIGDL